MSFTPIDMKTWRRAAEFRFFSVTAPEEISATATVDVTKLRAQNVKFTPAFLWLVTDCLNRQPEFRMGVKDGTVGFFDAIHPIFPSFHEDDKSLSNLWVAYQPFDAFLAEYTRVTETYGNDRRFFARRDAFMPENTFVASALPWLDFTHFSAHNLKTDAPRYSPSVEWGRFTETDGKTTLPVSLTVHHAAADGYHMAKFFEDLQAGCDTFHG